MEPQIISLPLVEAFSEIIMHIFYVDLWKIQAGLKSAFIAELCGAMRAIEMAKSRN
jgi:hypothetical protein